MLRTRMQSEIFRNQSNSHYNKKYNNGILSIYSNVKYIINKEGVGALYKGISASYIGIIHPLVFFPVYEKSKIYFLNNYEQKGTEKLSAKYIFIASTLSKTLASVASYPHEILRARL